MFSAWKSENGWRQAAGGRSTLHDIAYYDDIVVHVILEWISYSLSLISILWSRDHRSPIRSDRQIRPVLFLLLWAKSFVGKRRRFQLSKVFWMLRALSTLHPNNSWITHTNIWLIPSLCQLTIMPCISKFETLFRKYGGRLTTHEWSCYRRCYFWS